MNSSEWGDALLGALVGLANAVRGNEDPAGKTAAALCRQGLAMAMRGDADDNALRAMTERVRAEKWRIVPDCAVCAFPCGRNNDYDMSLLWTDDERIQSLKIRLLRAAAGSAACPQEILFEALRSVGDIWEIEILEETVQKIERCCEAQEKEQLQV